MPPAPLPLRHASATPPSASASASSADPETSPPTDTLGRAPAVFRPRLILQTLGRGDGLLGLRPAGPFGPRGEQVTVARIDWTYDAPGGLRWETPAPASVLYRRADPHRDVEDAAGRSLPLRRDPDAEAEAAGLLWTLGLHPVPAVALQWRSDEAAAPHAGPRWSLLREEDFGDFWADRVPELQARGWSVLVRPGFAHQSLPVAAWRLRVRPETGEELGREPAAPLAARPRAVGRLGLPAREGSWLLTLGIEVEGESLDLAPLLADLLRRDARWRDLRRLAAIDPAEPVALRMPGGRRITAPAAPLQAIVGAMLDLLTDPKRAEGPLRLSAWDAHRLDDLRRGLDRGAAGPGADPGGGRGTGAGAGAEAFPAPGADSAGPAQDAWRFDVDGDDALRALAQRLRAAGAPPPVAAPHGLGVTLRPYQQRGLDWLQYLRAHGLAGILADDMGLGKTAQALAHLLLEKESGRADRPSLVVVPTSLVFNWQAEARRMAPGLRLLVLQGAARADDFGRMAAHDLVVTTYPLVWRDLDALRAQPFHLLVLDEAQTVKNPEAHSARALRRLRARHRLCLTGTPLENHLGELWAQFDFLMPGFLGDARSFQRLWRKPIEEGGETLRADLLARRIRPFVLRRRKEAVATELPPRTEIVERVPLRGRQRALYESVRVAADRQVRRVLQRSGFAGAQIAVLDALLKLRQVCCDPRLLRGGAGDGAARAGDGTDPSAPMERAKIERLRSLLPALVEDGRRILLFSQFTGMLALVGEELDALGLPWLALTGDTPAGQRGEVVRRFQAREAPLLLASLKAGGTGLNLTAADTVVHLNPWWNPAVEAQATARAHRIGQDRPVFVYQLLVEGSIEERMRELQARKAALAEGVLGHDAPDAAKFGPRDLDLLLAPLDPDTR